MAGDTFVLGHRYSPEEYSLISMFSSLVYLNKDPILRSCAKQVDKSVDIQALASHMRKVMVAHDGIGIAAPQVGELLRVFLVAKELFPPEVRATMPSDVFMNPKAVRKNFKRERGEEGCLSVPGVYGEVRRHQRMTVEAYDADWKKFRIAAEGLLATVLQHELDHLQGVLFIDRAEAGTLHEILPDGTLRPWNMAENVKDQNPNAK